MTQSPIQGDTLLAYLIDRSGSMQRCWTDTIGGLNTDIATQKLEDDGKTEVAIYFFDGGSGKDDRLIKAYEGPIAGTPEISPTDKRYVPRSTTPLHDAAGTMITEIKDRVAISADNPNVLVTIFTDGYNNHHDGYTDVDVKQMVEICQGKGWTFTYFGANQDAWKVSQAMGLSAGNVMSYDTANIAETMQTSGMARSSHLRAAKMSKMADPSASYASQTFFADAGQDASDYSNVRGRKID